MRPRIKNELDQSGKLVHPHGSEIHRISRELPANLHKCTLFHNIYANQSCLQLSGRRRNFPSRIHSNRSCWIALHEQIGQKESRMFSILDCAFAVRNTSRHHPSKLDESLRFLNTVAWPRWGGTNSEQVIQSLMIKFWLPWLWETYIEELVILTRRNSQKARTILSR